MIHTCDKGHSSLDAANWKCPWCEIEQLRAELIDRNDQLITVNNKLLSAYHHFSSCYWALQDITRHR